jgi:glycosyltransferase involved in cell wall biosynthesis
MSRSIWVMLAAAGRPELLKRTLESIAACQKPAHYARTLIIENGPRCGMEQIVRSFAPHHAFQYLYSEAPNKSLALNLGLAHVTGGLIVFTDDDVRVRHDWLVAYAAAANGRTGGQYYGGPVHVDAEHGLPPEWMRRYYPATLALPWELPHQGSPTEIPGQTFMGPNWAAFATEVVSIGGFDPNLGPRRDQSVGEETEVQRRLAERGSAAIFVPDAMTWHYLHRDYLDPQWLLERTYRHGLAWGIARTRGGQPWVAPIARSAIKGVNAHVKAALLRLAGGERRRFVAAYLQSRWRGRWDGLWQGRQWPDVSISATAAPPRSRAA